MVFMLRGIQFRDVRFTVSRQKWAADASPAADVLGQWMVAGKFKRGFGVLRVQNPVGLASCSARTMQLRVG
jgi:hypothetical protein